MTSQNKKSALHVNKGIDQPSSMNERLLEKLKSRKKSLLSIDEYVDGILSGDRVTLSKAITLVESNLGEHYETAQKIIERCLPYSGNSIRIGITGVPGVGKSSFIEALGNRLTSKDKKMAVLAIDPSSERSKGSILGDKTRMESLSGSDKAFIRPSPSAGSLGGVARKTREIIILCEAAGFDHVFVETVGVGQSEIAVHSMVDFFLLLMLSGAGDELQGIKRGIMEISDAIVINKADGSNKNAASQAAINYANALHLFPAKESGWTPRTQTCSSITGEGILDIWEMVLEYIAFTKNNKYFYQKRQEQEKFRMYDSINERLKNDFYQNPKIRELQKEMETMIIDQKISAYVAAQRLFSAYKKGYTGSESNK
ncbi:MAG: methylmalonyl Co-A mutase-associated GTPase MeaB [Bacteroidales bacterium]|nr:methylmalonyl Co-A mutase-associated GTPase MeaB [Bacteroidales bacterium]